MSYHLDFLNKNMYRKYPIRASSTHVFENGQILPASLISSIQVTVPYAFRDVYISKIYGLKRFLSVVVSDVDSGIALGSFSGKITKRFQVLSMESFLNNVSGSLVVGDPVAMDSIYGANFFSTANGRLEDSTVFCFTPPGVTKLVHEDREIKGHITLATDNITLTEEPESILLSIINTELISSNNDFHGDLNNCPTPLIKKINTVFPDEDGNIDIYGILPVTIEVGTAEVEIVPGITLDQACPERLKIYPPDNDSNDYYTDILTATKPEWRTWPNFTPP